MARPVGRPNLGMTVRLARPLILPASILRPMPILIFYRYRAFDPIRRRWYVTHAMTEQDAARLEEARQLEWSREERNISEDWRAMSASSFRLRSR